MKMLTVAAFLVFLVFVGNAQQKKTAGTAIPEPLDYKLDKFEITDTNFVDAISELSRFRIEGLHLGLEEVLRERASDSPVPAPRFSLSVHDKTVREILDSLCNSDGRYAWGMDGKTINIYPKATAEDDAYLLNRRLARIAVTSIPDPYEGLTFLDRQLPPPREQLAYAGVGGDPSYAEPWTADFEDITVRRYINRLTEHMGSHTTWLFYGSKQERLFMFLKGGFH